MAKEPRFSGLVNSRQTCGLFTNVSVNSASWFISPSTFYTRLGGHLQAEIYSTYIRNIWIGMAVFPKFCD